MKKIGVLFLLLSFYSGFEARAQTEVPELNSARPDFTQSPITVPQGYVQLETGLEYSKTSSPGYRVKNWQYPTTAVRVGILKWAELGFSFNYGKEKTRYQFFPSRLEIKEEQRGFDHVELRSRFNIFKGNGWVPEIGLQANLTLPIGDPELRPENPAPEIVAAFSHELNQRVNLLYNIGYRKETEDNITVGEFLLTLNSNIKFNQTLTGFAEVIGEKQKASETELKVNTGLLVLLRNNFQVDVYGGLGLTSNAPDYLVGSGLTWRFPR